MIEPIRPLAGWREGLPDRREHNTINFAAAAGFSDTAGLGYFDAGRLAEVFLNVEKTSTARNSAGVASLALQPGAAPETIRRALTRNGDGSASGGLGTLLDLLASGSGA